MCAPDPIRHTPPPGSSPNTRRGSRGAAAASVRGGHRGGRVPSHNDSSDRRRRRGLVPHRTEQLGGACGAAGDAGRRGARPRARCGGEPRLPQHGDPAREAPAAARPLAAGAPLPADHRGGGGECSLNGPINSICTGECVMCLFPTIT